ncbi:Hypothetical protein CINCED_3A014042 [Cinara cedri]|uniref:Uncharacterized protein n=1 Tax=Cinara cedri TaxID=506608 RepID=A0A5E4MBS8_9HEMI|nr:Hypothetical protein CINCED_3A014042 [Cinara cedri]
MEKYDTQSLTSNNYTNKIENNVNNNIRKHDPFKFEVDSKIEVKKSQLLSLDGWENYQKELIRLCFEFWEVNETQKRVNSLESNFETPLSLFEKENIIGFETETTRDNVLISGEFQKKETFNKVNDYSLKSKNNVDPLIQHISEVVTNDSDCTTNEYCSTILDTEGNKRTRKKKLKNLSFYKHMNKHEKPNKKIQSFAFDKSASSVGEDLWKCKKWLDSVEKIKNHHNPSMDPINNNIGENSNQVNYKEKIINNKYNMYPLDIEARQMEQKVKKLIKSLKEKDRLLMSIGINEQSPKFGPSNKFIDFFKNAFRGNQNELDIQVLEDYTTYINQKLNKWQGLLHCLEDIKHRESRKIKTTDPQEDTIKYRFTEKRDSFNNTRANSDDYGDKHLKFVEINSGRVNETASKQKTKKMFFNLLNKTRSTVDVCAVVKRTERIEGDAVRATVFRYRRDTEHVDRDGDDGGRKSAGRIRRCLSDTDLVATARNGGGRRTALKTPWGGSTMMDVEDGYYYNCGENKVHGGIREERHECFQTAVARLEYVGSTFKEQCRLAGLKVLCKVDVLAEFGYSAEAVDLFVSAALPLSDNPDLMIRKAEAAYDWRFFCHLSMWRHSYKD